MMMSFPMDAEFLHPLERTYLFEWAVYSLGRRRNEALAIAGGLPTA